MSATRRHKLIGLVLLMLATSAVAVVGNSEHGEAALLYETYDPTPGPLGPISVIGDSVMVGSVIYAPTLSDQLVAHGWGPVRVRAGRGTTSGYFNVSREAKASFWVDRWKSEGWDPRDVVVNIGSNDAGYCETSVTCARAAISHLADAIGPGHRIWWPKITHISAFITYQNNWNLALDQIAAERDNFVVWDWPTTMANGPFPSSDGIHLNPTGYRLRSLMMASEVTATYGIAFRVGADAALPTAAGPQSEFLPLTTARAIDTRLDPPGRLAAGQTIEVDVSALVPDGTNAIAAYAVAVDAGAPGYLTAYDCAHGRPLAANVNYGRGETRGAVGIVSVDAAGKFCLFTLADADVVVDVQGAFVSSHPDALRFEPLPQPVRLVDSRLSGGPRQLTVVQAPAGAEAVSMNVTAVAPAQFGFVVAYPCSEPVPLGATVNYVPGDVIGGAAFVPVGDDGTVCVWSVTPTDITVDLVGTFSGAPGGLAYLPVHPTRMIDTRDGTGGWSPIHGQFQTIDALVAPPSAQAVSGTLSIAGPVRDGYLRAWSCAGSGETASVNAGARAVLSNSVTSAVDPNGRMCVLSSATTSSIFDVSGWWVPS